MEGETNNQEKPRLERRKGITFNFELQSRPSGYPIYFRISEGGQHRRFKTTIELKRKSDWDSSKQKIKPSEDNHERWQSELDQLMETALNIHRELQRTTTSSSDKIIEQLRVGGHSESFLKFAETKVQECRTAGRMSSMNKYSQVCRKFIAFMEARAGISTPMETTASSMKSSPGKWTS